MENRDKLTITQQSLGRRGTTAIHLDIDTYLKVEKISIVTGRRKAEILAQMVDFALEHSEIDGCEQEDFDFGLKPKPSRVTSVVKTQSVPTSEGTPVFVPVKEAVKITGLSEYYLRHQLKNGNIPAIRSGNKWLIRIEDFLEVLRGDM